MLEYFNTTGIDTYQNLMQAPLDGQLIHALNVVSSPFGGKSKRPGYEALLNNPDSAQVNSLFLFGQQNDTKFNLFRASGSLLYYSLQGTGNWSIAGNGTITNGNHVQGAVLLNTLIVGDGVGSTRHSTDGTSFINTTLAPIGQYFTQFHNSIYTTNGTNSTMTKSTTGDATNWSIGGTSDSTSLTIPDEGAAGPVFVAGDRLIVNKNKGKMFNWDDYSLVDMTTKFGPRAPFGIGNIDDLWFYINQVGMFSFDGANRQLLSNPVQKQFYSRGNTGINAFQNFRQASSAVGVGHIWDYFITMGNITDDFTGRTINNCILNYNLQKNEFLNWSFNDNPTAFVSYIDNNLNTILMFGNAAGQCFTLDATQTSDANAPIATEMVYLFTYASMSQSFSPTSASAISGVSYEKKWNWIRLFFNPGNEMNVQFAFSNTMTYQHLKWSEGINIVAPSDGTFEYRFPNDPNNSPRSKFLFMRLYEKSDSSFWTYLGCQIDAEPQLIK